MAVTNFDSVAATLFTGSFVGDIDGELADLPVIARTATAAPGGTTGVIPDGGGALQVVSVTVDDANKVITLPAPVPGTVIILENGSTGYELRSSAPATVAINGGTGANAESAVAASVIVIVVCTSATTWLGVSVARTSLETAA